MLQKSCTKLYQNHFLVFARLKDENRYLILICSFYYEVLLAFFFPHVSNPSIVFLFLLPLFNKCLGATMLPVLYSFSHRGKASGTYEIFKFLQKHLRPGVENVLASKYF